MIDVIKKSGKRKTERFSSDKLTTSIRFACLSVRSPEGEADDTARAVAAETILWLTEKPAVTSQDIRQFVAKSLEQYHPDAAYYYQHHKNII